MTTQQTQEEHDFFVKQWQASNSTMVVPAGKLDENGAPIYVEVARDFGVAQPVEIPVASEQELADIDRMQKYAKTLPETDSMTWEARL